MIDKELDEVKVVYDDNYDEHVVHEEDELKVGEERADEERADKERIGEERVDETRVDRGPLDEYIGGGCAVLVGVVVLVVFRYDPDSHSAMLIITIATSSASEIVSTVSVIWGQGAVASLTTETGIVGRGFGNRIVVPFEQPYCRGALSAW
jgi:hypothetical protein